jgi:hypothetical protein
MRRWKKLRKGPVVGLYSKLHPAINQSICEAGGKTPVFTIGDLTFGILIRLDSNYEVTLTPYPRPRQITRRHTSAARDRDEEIIIWKSLTLPSQDECSGRINW